MKKYLLVASVCLCLIVSTANAQVSFNGPDSIFVTMNKGSVYTLEDTIFNGSLNTVNFTWSVDGAKTNIPSGDSIKTICFLPFGQCYSSNFSANHNENIQGKTAAFIETKFYMQANPPANHKSVITIAHSVTTKPSRTYIFTPNSFPSAIENLNKIINVYPQPAKNSLTIMHYNTKCTKAIVYNVIGNKVLECSLPKNTNGFSLNIEGLNNGYFYINLLDDNNNSVGKKKFLKN